MSAMYEADELPGERYQRTVPWAADEFIAIGKGRYVYTRLGDRQFIVHFPGGVAEHVSTLRDRGVAVVLPRVLRDNNQTQTKPVRDEKPHS